MLAYFRGPLFKRIVPSLLYCSICRGIIPLDFKIIIGEKEEKSVEKIYESRIAQKTQDQS